MDFLEIIDEKLSKVEDEFISNSNNNLSNCKQLLDYIYALKTIQSLYRTVASDGDNKVIVDAINNGASSIVSRLDTTNGRISSVNSTINLMSDKLDKLSRIETQCDEIIKKLEENYFVTKDINAKMVDANNYLKTISEK